jgi:hypothetical protein
MKKTTYLLTHHQAKEIFDAINKKQSINVSFDLGLTKSTVEIRDKNIILSSNLVIGINQLKDILKDKKSVFYISEDGISKVCFFKRHFYKLVLTGGYPTIEIDGIKMHQTKEMMPEEDAGLKIALLNIFKKAKVLDICTGLGYTAIAAYRKGAEVITIEKDPNVLEIAKLNPYSKELFEGKIKLIIADAFDEVKKFKDASFDFIIHDPPRFALAELLYSTAFYKQLYRILKPNGRLFHYVGSPGAKYRKKRILKGVMDRLLQVGFKLRKEDKVMGILGIKCL